MAASRVSYSSPSSSRQLKERGPSEVVVTHFLVYIAYSMYAAGIYQYMYIIYDHG